MSQAHVTPGVFHGQMPGCSLRLVAQQVRTDHGPIYRLVAYAREYDFAPVEFHSLEDLRSVVFSSIPDFDSSEWNEPTSRDTQIVFATGLSLSKEQILRLGFTMSAR